MSIKGYGDRVANASTLNPINNKVLYKTLTFYSKKQNI